MLKGWKKRLREGGKAVLSGLCEYMEGTNISMSYERDTSVLSARALPQNYEVVRVSCRGECVCKM